MMIIASSFLFFEESLDYSLELDIFDLWSEDFPKKLEDIL